LKYKKLVDKSLAKETVGIDVLGWSSADVTKWALSHPPLNQYASKFESHGVDGIMLFELNGEDLGTIGVRVFHREKYLK